MRVIARAKINLRLRVLAREESGFHQIETLFCRLALADTIDIEPAAAFSFDCDDASLGSPDANLVVRAVRAFDEMAGTNSRVRIRLQKQIPAGAGLGGGSSDAAATLQALNELHGRVLGEEAVRALGVRLGSDVPFFLADVPLALAWGRGERVLPLPPPPPAAAIIVTPAQRIATAHAYAELARHRDRAPAAFDATPLDLDRLHTWDGIATIARNDFDAVADTMVAAVPGIRRALAQAGARITLLSGSGSALFGIFPSASLRDDATSTLRRAFPDASIVATEAAV